MSIFDVFRKKKTNADLKKLISSLGRTEFVLSVEEENENIKPDDSKLGGKPYLPQDFMWPKFSDEGEERPLSFLCQINLTAFKKYDRDGLLPEKGMLYFFYDCEAFRWGFDPEDKGCARVFYF